MELISITSDNIYSFTRRDYLDRASPHEDRCDQRGAGKAYQGYFYFVNPKTGSSTISMMIDGDGPSSERRYNPETDTKPILIVREPISRWLSGTMEYLKKYNIDIEDFLEEEVYELGFDRHTAPQCWFLPYDIDHSKIDFVKWSPTVYVDLQKEGHFQGLEVSYQNVSAGTDKEKYYPRLLEAYTEQNFDSRLHDFYWRDYEFFAKARDLSLPTPI